MTYFSLFSLFFLIGCATSTPLKKLPIGTEIKDLVYMKPDPKICKYHRSVEAKDEWAPKNNFNTLKKDFNHLAAETGANVGHIVFVGGIKAKVELFKCPEEYVQNYLKKNFEE